MVRRRIWSISSPVNFSLERFISQLWKTLHGPWNTFFLKCNRHLSVQKLKSAGNSSVQELFDSLSMLKLLSLTCYEVGLGLQNKIGYGYNYIHNHNIYNIIILLYNINIIMVVDNYIHNHSYIYNHNSKKSKNRYHQP